jgi:membrane fusion protein (multidrug efflux system)
MVSSIIFFGCDKPKQAAAPLPEVAAVTIQPEHIVLTTELPGRTSAYRIAEIRPQVNGIVLKRLFREGTDVLEGQELYLIDPAPFQAAVDSAKAALAKSEANLPAIRSRAERYRGLLAEKAVSQQDYDDREAALKQAEADIEYWKAALETARINLKYTRVTAPISGRIGKSNITDGALVTAYQQLPLSTIQQIDPIYVDLPQSTTELLRLKSHLEEGRLNVNGKSQRKVLLFLKDGAEYPMTGTLQFRDVTVDPSTASVILRIVFPNPEGLLLPGMFVRARVQEGISEQAILVPQQAVSRDPKGNPSVFTVDSEGRARQRMLKLDRAIGDRWLVASGLSGGDRVIVEGLQRIRPGSAVRVVSVESKGKAQDQAGQPVKQSPDKRDGGA